MLGVETRGNYNTLLDAVALKAGDGHPAIIFRETAQPPIVVTRHQFRQRVHAYCVALKTVGICPRDLVVIAHTQNLESIYLFWAVMMAGAIPSMFPTLTEKLDPAVYMSSMAELTRLSDVAAVLTTDEFAPALRNHLPCVVFGTAELFANETTVGPTEFPVIQADPADIAFLQHSSGTTGLQKGVALSHSSVLNQISAYSDTILLRPNDVIASWLPLYHDMGLIAGFLLPLVQGIPLVLMSPFDWVTHPALLLQAIHDHEATLCWLPNFAYNHCARRIRRRDSEGLSLATMRLFVNCSEPVHHQSHQQFLERFAQNGVRNKMLGVSYAMAENTFAVTQTSPGRPASLDFISNESLTARGYAQPLESGDPASVVKVSCGSAIPGTEVKIVNSAGREMEDRTVGEIVIRSNCLLSGYFKRPDLQPIDSFGWYHTGDIGYMVDDQLYVIGRQKDLIISAGKNIYPADIEAIVNTIKGVHAGRAVAFGVDDEREGTELIAVVAEVSTTDDDEKRSIAREIRQEIARQSMVNVSYVHLVGPRWLLKTSSGKITRNANKEKWLQESHRTG